MVASVFILKEKMRGTQIVGAIMLLSGLVMFFNTSLIEIFTKLTDYTWGSGECVNHAHAAVYAVIFRSFIYGLARFLRQTDVKPSGLSRCVCRGCGRDVLRHWSSYLGRIT